MSARSHTLCLLAIATALAGIEFGVPLADTAKHVERIAWVHLRERKEARFDFQNASHSCGYVYTADVVRSIKGGQSAFRFFSEYDQEKDGWGTRDYLVLAHPHTPEFKRKTWARYSQRLTGFDLERARCNLYAADLFVWTYEPAMIAPLFVDEFKAEEPWGLSQKRNVLSEDDFPVREFRLGERRMLGVQWSQIERIFHQILDPYGR